MDKQNAVSKTDSGLDLVVKSTFTVHEILSLCPNPSQSELRKILAVQGYMLNQVGLDLLGKSKVGLALKALAASREALKSASAIGNAGEVIEIPQEKSSSDSDSTSDSELNSTSGSGSN